MNQVGRFVAESLPIAAVAHSYLADMRWDPGLGEHPAFAAWSSFGLNLARLLHRRQITMERAALLPAALRLDPRGQFMLSLIDQGNRQIQRYLPTMLQIIGATGWSGTAPMVCRQP